MVCNIRLLLILDTQDVHISTKAIRPTTSFPKSTLSDTGEAEIMLITEPLTRQTSTTPTTYTQYLPSDIPTVSSLPSVTRTIDGKYICKGEFI
jgi:hypothetical protein